MMRPNWIVAAMLILLTATPAFAQEPLPLVGDALVPSDFDAEGVVQTSEVMIDKVAVGVVLLESDGSIDPSTEDWTSQEQQKVFSEIVAGMNWWAAREPRANLAFYYDDHFASPLSTGYEPINRAHSDVCLWVIEAMAQLGYNEPGCFARVRAYNEDLRNQYQTDWAFTIFVVDSSNDADNKFSDGYFAWAYLGGPFMVMTYGNDGYGINRMAQVAAHEMGHIFRALDQRGMLCSATSGCADIPNKNSDVPPGCIPNPQPSIMKWTPDAWDGGFLDPFARGQVGWVDEDFDGIFDCADPFVGDPPCTLYLPVIGKNSRMVTYHKIY